MCCILASTLSSLQERVFCPGALQCLVDLDLHVVARLCGAQHCSCVFDEVSLKSHKRCQSIGTGAADAGGVALRFEPCFAVFRVLEHCSEHALVLEGLVCIGALGQSMHQEIRGFGVFCVVLCDVTIVFQHVTLVIATRKMQDAGKCFVV